MTFGKIIIIYFEIGFIVCLLQPALLRLFRKKEYEQLKNVLSSSNKNFRLGFLTGMLTVTVALWPMVLLNWYIVSPIIERRERPRKS